MKDVSEIMWPMEEKFIEKICHDIETQLQRKLLWKEGIVIIQQNQNLLNTELQLTI